MHDAKTAARKAGMAARQRASDAAHKAASAALTDALSPHLGRPLAGYMPMRGEADPLPAMQAAEPYGPVAVPVIEASAHPLRFRAWHSTARMVPGRFGALIPAEGRWITPEILIVPLLAFDMRGGRLGYGGGFYDRTLEGLRARGPVLAIGFALSAQECSAVPLEPTDQPLDLIVTDQGSFRVTG